MVIYHHEKYFHQRLYLITNGAITFNDGERAFVRNDINTALLKISADLRVPFMMHYKGYKYDEIAEQLNLPLGTVKSRIFFARKELSQLLHVYNH